jgi:competence protein ComEC
MSFAATVALIAVYEALRGQGWWLHTQTSRGWRIAKPLIGIAVTSLIAGLATAPFSAFHFNAIQQYGLLANLLAVPAMGLVVMPAAVIGVMAAPLGLDWLPFQLVGLGMGYIIAVAEFVAGLGGAVIGVRAGPPASLGLIACGGLFAVLWIGRGRWLGAVPALMGVVLWQAHPRPDVLIADSGRLFGIESAQGRVLSSDKGNGFVATSWLEDDGDRASQADAWARGRLERVKNRIEAPVPGLGRLLYVGTSDMASAAADCAGASILIAPNWAGAPEGPCLFVGPGRLAAEGALAIEVTPTGPVVRGALRASRGRAWSRILRNSTMEYPLSP